MNWLPRQNVVVPVDFSEESFAALATAKEMVEDSAHLHILHVLPVLEAADPGVIWETIDDEGREAHASEALHKELHQRGHEELRIVIRFGDPGYEIVRYARQIDAGLVVLSSHGKSALRHLLIGSVADRVVRLAHCPVLVLKR